MASSSICCPIDMEPRTLNHGQLNQEVAADVAQKMEPGKATTVFIEGLRPVVSLEEANQCREFVEQPKMPVDCSARTWTDQTPCQCSCESTSTIADSPDENELKEPISAPF